MNLAVVLGVMLMLLESGRNGWWRVLLIMKWLRRLSRWLLRAVLLWVPMGWVVWAWLHLLSHTRMGRHVHWHRLLGLGLEMERCRVRTGDRGRWLLWHKVLHAIVRSRRVDGRRRDGSMVLIGRCSHDTMFDLHGDTRRSDGQRHRCDRCVQQGIRSGGRRLIWLARPAVDGSN